MPSFTGSSITDESAGTPTEDRTTSTVEASASSGSSNDISLSDQIALRVGIEIEVPALIVAILTLLKGNINKVYYFV